MLFWWDENDWALVLSRALQSYLRVVAVHSHQGAVSMICMTASLWATVSLSIS